MYYIITHESLTRHEPTNTVDLINCNAGRMGTKILCKQWCSELVVWHSYWLCSVEKSICRHGFWTGFERMSRFWVLRHQFGMCPLFSFLFLSDSRILILHCFFFFFFFFRFLLFGFVHFYVLLLIFVTISPVKRVMTASIGLLLSFVQRVLVLQFVFGCFFCSTSIWSSSFSSSSSVNSNGRLPCDTFSTG